VRRAFIIRPFGTQKDRAGQEIDFERVSKDHEDMFKRSRGCERVSEM